jgi:hypothetical protein
MWISAIVSEVAWISILREVTLEMMHSGSVLKG